MAITASILPDEGPPQVGIDVTGLDPAGQRFSVEWSTDGETWLAVNGGEALERAGAAFVRDPFPPLNQLVTYRVVILTGPIPAGNSQTTILVEASTAYIQNPHNPREWVALVSEEWDGHILAWGSMANATYEQSVDLVQPIGARLPVVSAGQRMLGGEIPLYVTRETQAESAQLKKLLLNAGTYIVRGIDSDLLEPVAHVTVGSVAEVQTHMHVPGARTSTFELKARQVRPFTMRIAVQWFTYDLVKSLWQVPGTTYDDVKAARPGETYVSFRRDPTPP